MKMKKIVFRVFFIDALIEKKKEGFPKSKKDISKNQVGFYSKKFFFKNISYFICTRLKKKGDILFYFEKEKEKTNNNHNNNIRM